MEDDDKKINEEENTDYVVETTDIIEENPSDALDNDDEIQRNSARTKIEFLRNRIKDTESDPKNNLNIKKNNNNNKNILKDLPKDKFENIQKISKVSNNMAKVKAQAEIKYLISLVPPQVWLIIALILFILLLIFFIAASMKDNSKFNYFGLMGYDYYPNACTKVYVDNDIISIEDYVAGVVAGEVNSQGPETKKTIAISTRTWLITHNNGTLEDSDGSCIYYAPETGVNYQPQNINDATLEAVDSTRGLIITQNGEPTSGAYAASCVINASQARAFDPKGNYSDKYYYIRYGETTIPGDEKHLQPFELSKMTAIRTEYGYYESATNYAAQADSRADDDYSCPGNHPRGISQNGALYLEVYNNYGWDDIINYFYDGQYKIMSIYRSIGYNGEYPLNPNDEFYANLQFITTPFNELLLKNSTNIDEYNEYLNKVVHNFGAGTREAVVNVAVSLIGSLASMGYKLPYQWGGKYYAIGARSSWGSNSSTNCDSYANAGYNIENCYTNYRYSSFDCSGFVNWALVNGFQFSNFNELQTAGLYQTTSFNNTIPLNANRAVCEPGDVLVNEGHIVLIVGLDDDNKNYIIAESTGSNLKTGYGGVKLSNYSYGNGDYRCRSLESFYKNAGD